VKFLTFSVKIKLHKYSA